MKKYILTLLFIFFGSKAFALDYNVQVSGITYGTGTASFVLTGPAAGTQGTVTAISGTWAGETITGLVSYAGNDQQLNANGVTGDVTYGGISFSTSAGNVNISSATPPRGPIAIFNSTNPSRSLVPITVTITPVAVASVPTLSEWGMIIMASLMALLAITRMRRQG